MKYIGKMAETESLLSTCCSSNFSVALGGLYDIKRHSETSLHKKAVTATNKTPQLHQFMPTKSVDDQVTRAETLFSNFVAEQNQDKACLEFNPSDSGLIAAKKA